MISSLVHVFKKACHPGLLCKRHPPCEALPVPAIATREARRSFSRTRQERRKKIIHGAKFIEETGMRTCRECDMTLGMRLADHMR